MELLFSSANLSTNILGKIWAASIPLERSLVCQGRMVVGRGRGIFHDAALNCLEVQFKGIC